jgi:hypothetical protein
MKTDKEVSYGLSEIIKRDIEAARTKNLIAIVKIVQNNYAGYICKELYRCGYEYFINHSRQSGRHSIITIVVDNNFV